MSENKEAVQKDWEYESSQFGEKERVCIKTLAKEGTGDYHRWYSGALYELEYETEAFVVVLRKTTHWGPGGDNTYGVLYAIRKDGAGKNVGIASAALVVGGTYLKVVSAKEADGALFVEYKGISGNEFRRDEMEGEKTIFLSEFK